MRSAAQPDASANDGRLGSSGNRGAMKVSGYAIIATPAISDRPACGDERVSAGDGGGRGGARCAAGRRVRALRQPQKSSRLALRCRWRMLGMSEVT
jgi:hypothetical protein